MSASDSYLTRGKRDLILHGGLSRKVYAMRNGMLIDDKWLQISTCAYHLLSCFVNLCQFQFSRLFSVAD